MVSKTTTEANKDGWLGMITQLGMFLLDIFYHVCIHTDTQMYTLKQVHTHQCHQPNEATKGYNSVSGNTTNVVEKVEKTTQISHRLRTHKKSVTPSFQRLSPAC